MEEGYTRDHYGSPSQWIVGVPQMGFWGRTERGREKIEVRTLRCTGCGYMESYAKKSKGTKTMRKLILTLTLALATTAAFAGPSVLRKNGDCKLQVGGAFDDDKVVPVTLSNSDLEIVCKFHGGDFFDEFTLFANPSISNKSGKKLNVAYHVAFFDKAGELVACAGQSGDVDADAKDHQFGSCLSKLSQAEFAKITSYKVVVYVDNAKAKK
jgi:hypothetical protein